jgi:hypothetical protein
MEPKGPELSERIVLLTPQIAPLRTSGPREELQSPRLWFVSVNICLLKELPLRALSVTELQVEAFH